MTDARQKSRLSRKSGELIVEALQFYSNPKTYEQTMAVGPMLQSAAEIDRGAKARAAVAALQEQQRLKNRGRRAPEMHEIVDEESDESHG